MQLAWQRLHQPQQEQSISTGAKLDKGKSAKRIRAKNVSKILLMGSGLKRDIVSPSFHGARVMPDSKLTFYAH